MNILFITLGWPEAKSEHNLYTDLMEEFKNENHTVYVVGARERRIGKPTEYNLQNGIHVLRVRCGNIQKTNPVEKFISSICISYQMRKAVKKYYKKIQFDLIIYSTPPLTLCGIIKYLKKKYHASTYLLLKDIWPQSPADLGFIRKGGLIWRYLRYKEKKLYNLSDKIGCMSPANVQYLLEYNKKLEPKKVEECPNSIIPRIGKPIDKYLTRRKYHIPNDSIVFIFGGNIGKPQGVGFLADTAFKLMDNKKIFFVIIGSGTEFPVIEHKIRTLGCNNVMILKTLPKEEYEELCAACDVGLILLDQCFTIPNFPSRLLTYLDMGKPVICATDDVCDMGNILEEYSCGIKVRHGDTDGFISALETLSKNEELRALMGANAKSLLLKRYTAKHSYDVIMKHLKGEK